MLLKITVVPLQIEFSFGVFVKLASGAVCIFIGPKALLVVPHGFFTVIEAWKEFGYNVPLFVYTVPHEVIV